ncbi:hypothetical protein NEFER03_1507 [Nematocida sp. LUAm3]|nr:hypothetical protein NEFER03_1507 [Nematocida sp. LUAm3]KAI5174540.1 hypothetical protein NEFER02_0661 [Nematocida sp. LUAm2]KAI5178054.1 hypothetical protein NEFER01_1236 [Nematocida sp. LUAm1]
MSTIATELHKIIEKHKQRIAVRELRQIEKDKLYTSIFLEKEVTQQKDKEDDEQKRARRRSSPEKAFKGCLEEEAEEDLIEIFKTERLDKYIHTLPNGRSMIVIKKNILVEGDVIRIEKRDAYDVGMIRSIQKGMLILENKEREKKYLFSKLLSSRYVIIKQNMDR